MDSTTYALPATPKQIAYARSLALRNQTLLPWEVQQDRRSLSAWIQAQAQMKPVSDMDRLPTSKQVAFAEKLARIKRRAVPMSASATRGSCRSGSTGTGDLKRFAASETEPSQNPKGFGPSLYPA